MHKALLFAPVVVTLLAAGGCAGPSAGDDAVSDNAALSGAANAPFKCSLKIEEQVPVKKVKYRFTKGQANVCASGAPIPPDRIIETVEFNQVPQDDVKLLCTLTFQAGPDGSGEGVAFYWFDSPAGAKDFTLTPACDPKIPAACFATLGGAGVSGSSVLVDGQSTDKTESGLLMSANFSARLDQAKNKLDLIVGAQRIGHPSPTAAGELRSGTATAGFPATSPTLDAMLAFDSKSVDGFPLRNAATLACAR